MQGSNFGQSIRTENDHLINYYKSNPEDLHSRPPKNWPPLMCILYTEILYMFSIHDDHHYAYYIYIFVVFVWPTKTKPFFSLFFFKKNAKIYWNKMAHNSWVLSVIRCFGVFHFNKFLSVFTLKLRIFSIEGHT